MLVANITYTVSYFLTVTSQIEKVYEILPLDQYSPKERLLIRLADILFFLMIKAVGSTIRFEVDGLENLESIELAGDLPIFAVWHDRIFLGTYYFQGRGIVFLTSQSFDDEYIARFLQRFGYGVIRGSSTRGGAAGLVEMIRKMRLGLPMGFTVDGPKGPRYQAKTGAVLLAKKTGNPILPFIIEAEHCFTIKSWDRLQIPRPFTRAKVLLGKPIEVAPDASDTEIELKRSELQHSLDVLVRIGEEWRKGSNI